MSGKHDQLRVIGFYSTVSEELANRRLDGVVRYADEHSNMSVRDFRYQQQTHDVEHAPAPPWIGLADGVIVCIGVEGSAEEMARWLKRGGVPVVSLVREWRHREIPTVDTDAAAVMKMAASYLAKQGYKHFAFVGSGLLPNDTEIRRQHFRRELAARGLEAPLAYDLMFRPTGSAEDLDQALREKGLIELLRKARKPIAIFGQNDNFARVICSLCERLEIDVPGDVAVLGSGNFTTSRCHVPAISTIQTAHDGIGFEAARVLNRMMNGEAGPTRPVLVKPLRIIERQSTNAQAFAKDDIQMACEYIRNHACDGAKVEDIVRLLSISRRTFETQFIERMRQTPKQMIQQVRLQRVQHLLTKTQLSLSQVAMMTGFGTVSAFTRFVHQHTGLTPKQVRDPTTRQRKSKGPPRRNSLA